MVSREQKGGVLHEKLQILRSVTHSHAVIFIFVLTCFPTLFCALSYILRSSGRMKQSSSLLRVLC
jgi:hypothetical protein